MGEAHHEGAVTDGRLVPLRAQRIREALAAAETRTGVRVP